jgi:hypothetical protein
MLLDIYQKLPGCRQPYKNLLYQLELRNHYCDKTFLLLRNLAEMMFPQ